MRWQLLYPFLRKGNRLGEVKSPVHHNSNDYSGGDHSKLRHGLDSEPGTVLNAFLKECVQFS